MHIRDFSFYNRWRCESVSGFNMALDKWSLADWAVALAGEVGEACNIVKKLKRIEDGLGRNNYKGEDEGKLRKELAKEIGDIYAYLDLFTQAAGLSTEECAIDKWDEVSERMNLRKFKLRTLVKGGE